MRFLREKLLKIAPYLIAATIVLGATVVFMGVVYNYTNSKSIVIEIGSGIVVAIGLLTLPWTFIKKGLIARVSLAVGGFLGVSVVAAVFGLDPALSWYSHLERGTGLFFVLLTAVGSLFAVLIARYTHTLRYAVLYPVAAATGIVAGSTIVGYTGFKISTSVILGVSSGGGGVTGNSSFAGTILMMGFFIVLYLVTTAKNRWERIGFLLLSLVVLINPVILGNGLFNGGIHQVADIIGDARGATASLLLGLVISLGVAASYSHRKGVAWIGRIAVAGVIAATIFATALLVIPGNDPINRMFVKEAGTARFIYWHMSAESFKAHPFLGTGPETFRYAHQAYFDPKLVDIGELWADKPHNAYLEMLVGTGLLGLLAYFAIMGTTVWRLRILGKESRNRALVSCAAGLLFAYLLNNLILFDTATSYLFLFLVLAWIGTEHLDEGDRSSLISFSRKRVTVRVMAAVAVIVLVSHTVIPEIKKLHLVWNEMFAPVSARMAIYQKGEDASPYGAGISFAQRADTYGQDYLSSDGGSKELALADISAISKTLVWDMLHHPRNMQEFIALAQLAHARMVIEGVVDPNALQEMYVSGQEVVALSPTNPRGYLILADALRYEGKNADADAMVKTASTIQESARLTP